eukprot:TRINITY_DN72101_c0_g1_i1.p1 TRINITY_DN72101_c0_g1~~TRINITY_DN72101_c0_g1_i1.p1  ORF type:complete len:295 (-),score=44.59 TRINITY_DN72101_c0_g1_i1:18-902(-)
MRLRSGQTKDTLSKADSRIVALQLCRSEKPTNEVEPGSQSDVLLRHRRRILTRHLTPEDEVKLRMPFDEWRKNHRPKKPGVDALQLPTWSDMLAAEGAGDLPPPADGIHPHEGLNSKVALYSGGVVDLKCDAIVNAANESCLGGGGVDGAVHRLAGSLLKVECATFNGCATGRTRITKGYNLPAHFVLHTVGPTSEDPLLLRSCYETCLELVLQHRLRTVAFCMISTGIFGYPLRNATNIALRTVRRWLQKHADAVDRVVFACYMDEEYEMYHELMPVYFPSALAVTAGGAAED